MVRGKIIPLIEQWQRITILVDRIAKRRENEAVRIPSQPRTIDSYISSPFQFPVNLPLFSPPASPSPSATNLNLHTTLGYDWDFDPKQADLARLGNVMKVVVEVNERCWRGSGCELCDGVRHGLGQVASHCQNHSDLLEQRTRAMLQTTVEEIKVKLSFSAVLIFSYS